MAIDFENGSSQNVTIPDVAGLEISGQITLCAWCKIESTGGLKGIIYKGVGNNQETWLRLNGTSLQGGTWQSSPGDTKVTHTLAGSELTDWHYFAMVYNGSAWKLYINAVEEASLTTVQGARPCVGVGWAIGSNSTSSRYFDGLIDDARIYDRGLSPEEIEIIYETKGTDAIVDGLVGKWLMSEKEPTGVASGASTVKDQVGGNHGTPNNSPAYTESLIRPVRLVI